MIDLWLIKLLEIVKKMSDPESGIPVKDRKWMFRSYPKSFVGKNRHLQKFYRIKSKTRTHSFSIIGSEAVDWILANHLADSREEAVALGQKLLNKKHFSHVTKDHQFKDEFLFYRFKEHDKTRLNFKERIGAMLGKNDHAAGSEHGEEEAHDEVCLFK